MIWITSDFHFGHSRIVELAYRPFDDVDHMNETLISNFNEAVAPDDHTFFLGDMVLGGYKQNLPLVSELNGFKTLIVGNHDKPYSVKNADRLAEVLEEYHQHFDDVRFGPVMFDGLILSHFPYAEDYQGRSHPRPEDNGIPVIHGHTHDDEVITYSDNGTLQFHVGVDAWEYRPVPYPFIKRIIRDLDTARASMV